QGGGIPGATSPGQPIVPSTGFGGGAFGNSFGNSSGNSFGSSFGQTQGGQNQGSNSSNLGQDLIRHVRFLRRVPVDPMTGKAEWGKRSVQDDPDSTSWGGKNVFDVFSLSTSTALDGSKYSDW